MSAGWGGWRLFSMVSSRKFIRDGCFRPESKTLLLVRENMPRPEPCSCRLIRRLFVREVGHSAAQLMDRLKPDESRLVLPEMGV